MLQSQHSPEVDNLEGDVTEMGSFLREETPPLDDGDVSCSFASCGSGLRTCLIGFCDPRLRFPCLKWMRNYSCEFLTRDFLAGVTVGLTVMPQSMAFALVAGLPPVYGLNSSFVGPLVYTLLGTSKDVTLGPTAVMSLVLSSYASAAHPEYAVLLTCTTGLVQILVAILQLGFLLNFVSLPVISGFTSGAAVLIAFGQVKDLTGIRVTKTGLIPQAIQSFKNISTVNVADLSLGLVCLVVLLALRQLKTADLFPDAKNSILQMVGKKVHWLVCTASNAIVVIAASFFVFLTIQLDWIPGFTLVGHVDSGFPPVSLPPFGFTHNGTAVSFLDMASDVQTGFIILPLLGILESIAIAKAFSRKNRYRIDPTQELLAMGAANLFSSFFQSYAITGSFSRTAINSQSNVATPLSGVFTSLVVVLSLLFLAPAFQYIPKSSLGALIIAAIIFNFDYRLFRLLWKVRKVDLFCMAFTCAMCWLTSAVTGIISGIVVSLLLSLWPLASPRMQCRSFRGGRVQLVKFAHGLSFPASEIIVDGFSELISDTKRTDTRLELVIVDLGNIWQVDFAAIASLVEVDLLLRLEGADMIFIRGSHPVVRTLHRAEIVFPNFTHFRSLEEALARSALAGGEKSTALDDRSIQFADEVEETV